MLPCRSKDNNSYRKIEALKFLNRLLLNKMLTKDIKASLPATQLAMYYKRRLRAKSQNR
jgi:hypothetical protein